MVCQSFLKFVTPSQSSFPSAASGALLHVLKLIFTVSTMNSFMAMISARASGSTAFSGESNVQLVHTIGFPNLRRALSDFALTLMSVSLPMTVIKSDDDKICANELAGALEQFRVCLHGGIQAANLHSPPSLSCTIKLMGEGGRHASSLPTISGACVALAVAQLDNSDQLELMQSRNLANTMVTLIKGVVRVWESFKQRFESCETHSARTTQNYIVLLLHLEVSVQNLASM